MLDEPYQNLIKPCKVAWELSETAAEPPHTAKPMTIKFDFFSGLVSFSFFSFATSCPCFSSFLFFGAAPAERKMKQKTRQTEETENRKTYKSQAFWDLFLREETAKSVGSRRRCCLALGAKKVKIMGVAQ
jgi:hypothetical protein